MKKSGINKTIFIIASLVWLVFNATILGVYSESATSYNELHWDYSKTCGPKYWYKLDESFKLCKKGEHQSPIDIKQGEVEELSFLRHEYRPSAIDVINNSYTIEFDYDPGSYFFFYNEKYELVQFHFHSPSEHTIGGVSFPMEIHFVHKNNAGKFLVVGILVKEGSENAFISDLWSHLPKDKWEHLRFKTHKINVNKLFPSSESSFHYSGSLTTPPCSEQVLWFVLKEPIELSNEQIDYFHQFYNWNARPVQPSHLHHVKSDN